jgi:multiple sugar transport system ATP-binding protein
VHDLTLDIADGEFLVLVGPSGCGKSTALRMIAGLEEVTSGDLMIGGRVVNDVEPKDRDIAMVFQNYALYPHMSVRENIGFSLRLAKRPTPEIERRVNGAAAILELGDHLDRKPGQLSGGQRQRVAMGRAIAKLRVQMRSEIARLQHELAVTTVYVTHDQVEAMTMGDRVAVLKDGYLQQVDTPQVLYDRPVNAFVAAFIGSPSMNLCEAALSIEGEGGTIRLGSQLLPLHPSSLAARPGLRRYHGRTVIVGVRPEDFEDAALAPAGRPTLAAPVSLIESLGSETMVHFGLDAPRVDSGDPDSVTETASEDFIGRFDPGTRVRVGEVHQVAVNTAKLHFFDPQTRAAIMSA